MVERSEGFIDTRGGKVWYEKVGSKTDIPIVVVHGGPGYPHDSLESLEDLADERQIIFYDQLGCGNSQRVADRSLWTVEYFIEELGEIVKNLDLKEFHLFGHSWGAGLAVLHASKNSGGLKSLILSDPYLSTPAWEKDAIRLLSTMPESVQEALKEDPESQEYKNALNEFYFKYLYGQHELSVATLKAEHKMNNELYTYMWGPNEFSATGILRDFDVSNRLPQIKVPTLLLCGRQDEATPETTEKFKNMIPNAKMHVFENSAHMPHWTEREEYMQTVRDFLAKVD